MGIGDAGGTTNGISGGVVTSRCFKRRQRESCRRLKDSTSALFLGLFFKELITFSNNVKRACPTLVKNFIEMLIFLFFLLQPCQQISTQGPI
jgi:hypothetical protein